MSAQAIDSPFPKGSWVRIVGSQGTYRVMKNLLGADGSLTLYGGDKNPRGHRGFRSVMPERLVPTTSPYGERDDDD